MIYVIALLLSLCISWDLACHVRHHPLVACILALIVAIAAVISGLTGQSGLLADVLNTLIGDGALAFFLFTIVMFTGCLKVGSKSRIRLKQVREPLAHIAIILSIGHVAYAFETFGPYAENAHAFVLCCTFLAALFFVLAITSLPIVREGMLLSRWQRIHRLAYAFFILLCMHCAWAQSLDGDAFASIGFLLIGSVYAIMRFRVLAQERRRSRRSPCMR